jgi:hypothetical protein
VPRISRAEAVTLFGACIGPARRVDAALFPQPSYRNLILYATASLATWIALNQRVSEGIPLPARRSGR